MSQRHKITGLICILPPQTSTWQFSLALQWRHNGRDGISNHPRLDCSNTSKLRINDLCEGNPPVTGGFPSLRTSTAEMLHLMTSSCAHIGQQIRDIFYRYTNYKYPTLTIHVLPGFRAWTSNYDSAFCWMQLLTHDLQWQFYWSAIEIRAWMFYMMTSPKWKRFPRYWPFVRGIDRSPVNSPHKGQWRGALMFSLWTNDWVNNREVGEGRRYHPHYDVRVMVLLIRHRSVGKNVLLQWI